MPQQALKRRAGGAHGGHHPAVISSVPLPSPAKTQQWAQGGAAVSEAEPREGPRCGAEWLHLPGRPAGLTTCGRTPAAHLTPRRYSRLLPVTATEGGGRTLLGAGDWPGCCRQGRRGGDQRPRVPSPAPLLPPYATDSKAIFSVF